MSKPTQVCPGDQNGKSVSRLQSIVANVNSGQMCETSQNVSDASFSSQDPRMMLNSAQNHFEDDDDNIGDDVLMPTPRNQLRPAASTRKLLSQLFSAET
eukprot:jgi/Bigna1/135497/aug1.29_g10205